MTAFNAAACVNSAAAHARSSSVALVLAALMATGGFPTRTQAQRAASDSARAAEDSLAARLRRAEEAIALLQQQLADQASSGITTRRGCNSNSLGGCSSMHFGTTGA